MIGEVVLQAISRSPRAGDYIQTVGPKGIEGALKTLKKEFPDLDGLIRGKRVLDFGCGTGRQAVAMVEQHGAKVCGLDIDERWLTKARNRADDHGLSSDQLQFTNTLEDENQFDVVISVNAMEHFANPGAVLDQMASALKPGGIILATFSPLWLSPFGHHMHFFCKLPWLHLIFSEKTVLKVRSMYRDDGAESYYDAGLNKMTLKRFESLIADSELSMKRQHYRGVKGISTFTRIPLVRELLTNRVTCLLA